MPDEHDRLAGGLDPIRDVAAYASSVISAGASRIGAPAGQVDRIDPVARLLEQRRDPLPDPAAAPGAVDEHERGHQAADTASASSRGSRRETTCEIPSAPIVTP